MDTSNQNYEKFIKIFLDTNEVHIEYFNAVGFTATAIWILDILSRKENEQITQTDIIKELPLNKQTVNTAVKKLIEQGLLSFVFAEGNRKSKIIVFTEKGKEFNKKYIQPMNKCEEEAFATLKPKEQATFLALYEKYIENLKIGFSNLCEECKIELH